VCEIDFPWEIEYAKEISQVRRVVCVGSNDGKYIPRWGELGFI